MKVIAIKDAPITKNGYTHNDISTWGTEDHLIIWHDKLETTMDVDPQNFITLREHRENKLKELGI